MLPSKLKDKEPNLAFYEVLTTQAEKHKRTIAAEVSWMVQSSQDYELFKFIVEMHPELLEQPSNEHYSYILKSIIEMHPELNEATPTLK